MNNEFAAQSHAGPAAPPEHAGLLEFTRALAQAGGRPPLDRAGRRMQWNSERGWFSRVEGPAPTGLAALTPEASRRRRETFALAERESRARRANRAQAAQQRAESAADSDRLIRVAEVRIEAPFTAGGQLLRAGVL
jgi:hypothetical protein